MPAIQAGQRGPKAADQQDYSAYQAWSAQGGQRGAVGPVGAEDPNQHYVLSDVIQRMPFRTYATKKRGMKVLTRIGEDL